MINALESVHYDLLLYVKLGLNIWRDRVMLQGVVKVRLER